MLLSQPCASQKSHWYVAVAGGTSLGQATFRSLADADSHWGILLGVSGGCQVNRLLGIEVSFTAGRQSQTALDCDPYWLSDYGERYFAPVIDELGHYYRDLRARTTWERLALQANFDVLAAMTANNSCWSLNVSPQLSAVTTQTKHLAEDYDHEFDRQWHLGLGGQVALGYRLSTAVSMQLYGGITCLTGGRFDNIPVHGHKSNLIYEGGLRLSYHFIK